MSPHLQEKWKIQLNNLKEAFKSWIQQDHVYVWRQTFFQCNMQMEKFKRSYEQNG